MKTSLDERYGVPALRRETVEHILLPGGRQKLTLAQLEKRCLKRLARLIADNAIWPAGGCGTSWQMGDYTILIFETTVAPDVATYVQFWSEPDREVDWEVQSGNMDPAAKPFITGETRRVLKEMGFSMPGSRRNFARETRIGNTGDAAAVARDVLRIFHDALGYRGTTPLVARISRSERSWRAVVHDRLTLDDAVSFLQRLGCGTRVLHDGRRAGGKRPGDGHEDTQPRAGGKTRAVPQRPLIQARSGDVTFFVTLDVPGENGAFHCVDFLAPVGEVANTADVGWTERLNLLNGMSRVARGWIDPDGMVCVGTSLCLGGGMTDAALAGAVTGWLQAVAQTLEEPSKDRQAKDRGRKRKKKAREDEGEAPDDEARRDRTVVH